MPAAIPFLSAPAEQSHFYLGTDQSTSGSPIQAVARGPMNDQALNPTGTVPVAGTGNTNVYVGTLVLLALIGIVGLHFAGFRFAGDVSVGRS